MISTSRVQQGFILPAVLVVSIGLMVVGLSLIQTTSSISDGINDQYLDLIANEAAEAGAVYANFCLKANNITQTWGPLNSKPSLTQATDCTGNAVASAPDYIVENGTYRSSFQVNNLEVRSDGAIIISSDGVVERVVGSVGSVRYTANRKQVVKWKQYKASVSSSGTAKTCSIVTNELYCWGANSNAGENFSGQLGDGTNTDSLVPVKVVQTSGVLAGKVIDDVVSAQYHSCALAEGKVYCWGRNFNGQLGNGTVIDSSVPVEVTGALPGKTVTAIGASGNTSCAIALGKIYCWGQNNKGTVGDGTTTTRIVPTLVNTTSLGGAYTATSLSTSGSRSYNMCAIAGGKAYCWGNNEAGQIGNGVTGATNVLFPTKVVDTGVLAGKTVTSISQDGYYSGNSVYTHVCVVANSSVYCWGDNTSGQLGRAAGNTTDSNVPVAVSTSGVLSGKAIQNVVVGLQHSCALANSKVYCWGGNGSGQVGDNSNTTRYVPVAVYEGSPGLLGKTITAIGGGANRGCALADYLAYCWGLNTDGQLGDGTQVSRKIPTESIFLRPKAPAFIF